jgi:hypothetical protein
MRLHSAFIAALALGVGLAGCSTPEPPHRKEAEQWHAPVAMLEKYADKDGVVTRAAMEAGLRADFNRLDTDHNGCLSQDEARAENQRRWALDASTYSPLIDFKQTGCIDFQEYAETARSLFDQLDRRGDGKLTPDELRPGTTSPSQQTDQTGGHHRHGGGNSGNLGDP